MLHLLLDTLYYWKLAIKKNNTLAYFYLGMAYFFANDIQQALHYITISAQNNVPNAQYVLGKIYLEGVNVQKDINKSIKYLTLSADQNVGLAQFDLGRIYYENKIVPRDIKKAIYYLELAANNNIKVYDARFYLGVVYYCNDYIQKDIKKAIHYFKESSSFNNNFAKNNLGVIYKNGDGVEKQIGLSIEYFQEAIKQKNDYYSYFNLAKIYYFGINIKRNILASIDLLEKIASNKFVPALLFLFYIYFLCDNKNIQNIKKAEHYLNKIKLYCNDMEFWSLLSYIFNNFNESSLISQRFIKFIKEYDLIYLFNVSFKYDFINYIKTETYYNTVDNEKWNQKSDSLNVIENINKDFYDGFYNE